MFNADAGAGEGVSSHSLTVDRFLEILQTFGVDGFRV